MLPGIYARQALEALDFDGTSLDKAQQVVARGFDDRPADGRRKSTR